MARRLALTSRWHRGRMEGRESKDDEYDRNNESEDAKRQEYESLFCRPVFVVLHCAPKAINFANMRLALMTTLPC